MSLKLASLVASTTLFCFGCSVNHIKPSPTLDRSSRWIVLPFCNHSSTPMAGERVHSMVLTILAARGLSAATVDEEKIGLDEGPAALFDDHVRLSAAMRWALQNRYDYAITGDVAEWQYKTGPGSEPAVGLTLKVIELQSGRVLWSATATRTGWGRSSASGTALSVLEELVEGLRLRP